MILGISASGREERVTENAVRAVLESSEEPYEFMSLAGRSVSGCRACLGCARDSFCHYEDDWLQIGTAMLEADAIVFGAPAYYGLINALGHAALERTFCFRHRERFRLAGKLGASVAVDRGSDAVHAFIRQLMESNNMAVVGSVTAAGYSQCYTCGFGHECRVGGVVGAHGVLERIEDHHLPPRFDEQPEAVAAAEKLGGVLGSILRARGTGLPAE